jgi:hypothetical protein
MQADTEKGTAMTTCNNCRHAEWQLTKHKPPRINKRFPGECRLDARALFAALPVCVWPAVFKLYRDPIRYDREHDRPCPFFEPFWKAGK